MTDIVLAGAVEFGLIDLLVLLVWLAIAGMTPVGIVLLVVAAYNYLVARGNHLAHRDAGEPLDETSVRRAKKLALWGAALCLPAAALAIGAALT